MNCILQDGRWSSVVSRIAAVTDLEATARSFGALTRVRKLRSAQDLLRLALIYGPGQHSLRSTAAVAADGGVVSLSDKGVLGRLRKMGDWLEHILQCLLQARLGLACGEDLGLSLVDSSVVCAPGSTGPDWRLHARYDPGQGRFADLVLTRASTAERVDHTTIRAGTILIQDRGYCRVRDFRAVLEARADFITRVGWNRLRLLDTQGARIDVMTLLPQGDAATEHTIHLPGLDRPLRLVLQRLPPAMAERQRKRVRRRASKQGHALDPRTQDAAGYILLLTSIPASQQSAERILALYRNRWQIELGFKRLKTLGGLDKLPACDPRLARTWLLAHLIAAVLTDDIANEIVDFPPWAQARQSPP